MTLHLDGVEYAVNAGESVLDTLLRHGVELPNACRRGVCQACLLRSLDQPPRLADAQRGLRDTLRQQGFFMACQCPAEPELNLASPQSAELFQPALVIHSEALSASVHCIRLQPEQALPHQAGQFLNLRRADGLVRSYSIASVPALEPYIELHVQRRQGGAMSQWLADGLQVGQSIEIAGPNGNCFYLPGRAQQSLLMIATGTGAAPLLGIARSALLSGHAGNIHFYHGSSSEAGFYCRAQLLALAAQHDKVHVHFCISGEAAPAPCESGRALDIALRQHPELSGFRVFLCGAPEMVNSAKKMAYLHGAAMQDIYADPFENRDLRQIARP
ncbi:FAD-binding oxidoreductase [Roseateles oligotrophus]|uniref:FAD-binding oxidoreductase n=1 Tax=Roseateles oligotrophus TaxID=1769250 RepID=A0ABT2YI17_9BURK|nr:FAD-binding oxidoreductase [Roseateles oligotrophus]MCV2369668.1 FAD-binding oxidoreductase [Roseateles oligotrophus]